MEEGQARFEPFFSVARDFGHDSSVVDLTGCSVLRKRGDLSELSPSADFLFYSVSKDGHIQCWDSSSKDCVFEYEFRYVGLQDPQALEDEIRAFARDELETRMHATSSDTGITIDLVNDMPGLEMDVDAEVVTFVKALAGRNDHAKVAFGTEAGLFHQRANIPTVVCGPGSIDQAHKPNEFIEMEQIDACEAFLGRLMDRVCES